MPFARSEITTGARESSCGEFEKQFKFQLTGSMVGPGIVLQRIRREYYVEVHPNSAGHVYSSGTVPTGRTGGYVSGLLTPAQINAYTSIGGGMPRAADRDYWEAWFIPASGTEPVDDLGARAPYNDALASAGIFRAIGTTHQTTRGTFIVEAEAFYYPLQALPSSTTWTSICATLGLRVGVVACAGILPSAASDPRTSHASAWATHVATPTTPVATDVCHVVAKWDSTAYDTVGSGFTGSPQYGETFVELVNGRVTRWGQGIACTGVDTQLATALLTTAPPVVAPSSSKRKAMSGRGASSKKKKKRTGGGRRKSTP